MRWLLIKDLQILRRSPLLVGLLIVYPIAIALMIGFALSSPPSKPAVAFYNEVPKNHGTISLGNQKLNVAGYASDLLSSVQPIKVHSRAEAIAAVRDGRALAAVVIPADLPQQIQSLITQGVGSPTVAAVSQRQGPDRAPVRRPGDLVAHQPGRAGRVQAGPAGGDQRPAAGAQRRQRADPGPDRPAAGAARRAHDRPGNAGLAAPQLPAAPGAEPGHQLRRPRHPGAGLRQAGAGHDRHAADRQRDPARRPHHAHRCLRGGDRGDRVADVRDDAAGGRDARGRAHRERIPAAGPRPGHPGPAAVGEGGPRRGLRHRGHAGDGRVRVAVRAPGLVPVRAVGGGAGAWAAWPSGRWGWRSARSRAR